MRKVEPRTCTIIAALLAGTAPTVAMAQQETQGAMQGRDIIVTAQKREQNLADVPMSISALSGENLKALGVQSAEDLQNVVPGFTYTLSTYQTPVYSIRGVGYFESSLSADPAVSVYVDEVPLHYSAMTIGASLDLERVEVLKGPQGILFGRNSTGGAVNYVAAKPTDDLQAGLDLSYGRFAETNIEGFVSGPIGENLSARLSMRSETSADWQQSISRDETRGSRDLLLGRILIGWDPTDRLSLSLNVNGWRDNSDTPAPQLFALAPRNPAFIPLFPETFDNLTFAPADARAADWTPGRAYKNDNDLWQVALRGNYDLNDMMTLTSITSYVHYSRDTYFDGDGIPAVNAESRGTGSVKAFNQELRLAVDTGSVRALVGGNYEHSKIIEEQFSDFRSSTGAFIGGVQWATTAADSDQVVKTSAVFGNLEVDVGDITLHAGLRYTKTLRDFNQCGRDGGDGTFAAVFENLQRILKGGSFIPIAPGGCTTLDENANPSRFFGELDEDNLSWRAGISWQSASDLLLYANASRGFKAGGFPTTTGATNRQFAPVPQERVDAFEAGLKTPIFGGSLQLSAAAFYMKYKDKQVRGYISDPLLVRVSGLISVPRSEIKGLEGQISGNLARGWTMDIGATYVDTEVKEGEGLGILSTLLDFKGSRLPFTPDFQAFANTRYTWDLSDSLDSFLGASLSYRTSTASTLGYEDLGRIKGYALLGLNAGIESKDGRWKASIYGENITDKYYWTSANAGVDLVVRYAGMPRTYGVRLSINY